MKTSTVFATALVGLVTLPTLVGCESGYGNQYAATVARSHGLRVWRAKPAVQADLVVSFGGQTMIDGTMLFETTGSRARLDLKDGSSVVFDGGEAWVSPAGSALQMGRFHVRTWPYFVAAPMKLGDPGSHLVDIGPRVVQGKTYNAARITFDPGTGDAPDDWYIAYADPLTHHLHALAYIVSYGKSAAEAEKEPHAMTYHDFKMIDGVVVATRWQFWHWSAVKAVHGEPLGSAQLSNIKFVEPAEDMFDKPDDARVDSVSN